jgi:hypothetical protein
VLVEGSEEHSYYRLASIHDDRMIIHAWIYIASNAPRILYDNL